MRQYIHLIAILILAVSCTAELPKDSKLAQEPANVFPDNNGATLPPNIAPMNLRIDNEGDDYITHIHTKADAKGIVVKGKETDINTDQWHKLLQSAKGDTIYTTVYVRHNGSWTQYPELKNPVAEEEVDPYISYRLIQPSYVDYEDIYICQRRMSDFEEKVIYDNRDFSVDASTGQCVNCHAYQDYNRTGRMQMHLRQHQGGTIIIDGKEQRKMNLKTDSTLSAGVYPAWHPTLPLIAYSVNSTGQVFHTRDTQKVEVIDYGSDLILFDMNTNKVYDIDCDPDEYETFPAWTPDGQTLFFCAAHYEQQTDNIDNELDDGFESLRYNIYSRTYNTQTMKFGDKHTVLDATALNKSASLPRVSPDGKYLLFTLGDYGQFHIWHHSARLCIMPCDSSANTSTSSGAPYTVLDNQHASYHSWSSNGRWIMFASRRFDGNYSRLYFAYFDQNGIMHKPFMLPQKRPTYNDELFRSYNVPEWMVEPVGASKSELELTARTEAIPAIYAGSALTNPMSKERKKPTVDAVSGASQVRGNKINY